MQAYTSVEVVGAYIKFIKIVNPTLNAMVHGRFEEAMRQAAEADAIILESARNQQSISVLPPFLGVPVSIKEAFSVKGMSHSSGLTLRSHVRASQDADAVRNLRR